VKGGRVIADWPVVEANLYEGLLADHLRAGPQRLETAMFPDSAGAQPLPGLLA
jgi:uncharacterized protein (DUF1501 family)